MKYHLLLIIFIIFCISGFSFSQSSLHPNVILIITDDQGYSDLGCNGNPLCMNSPGASVQGNLVNTMQTVCGLKY